MKRVLLWIPSFTWHIDFRVHDWIEEIKKSKEYEIDINIVDRKLIHEARNTLVKRCIIGKYDFLFMIDDDNHPIGLDGLKLLIEADKAIIGGIVRKRNWTNDLAIYDQVYDKVNDFFDFKEYKEIPEGDEVFEVANIWTWCILYKVEFLSKIYQAYDYCPFENKLVHLIPTVTGDRVELERFFDNPLIKLDTDWRLKVMRVPMSEDILFHYRARVGGFKLYAHRKVLCNHYGDDGQTFTV
jgi:hypothetical protein